MFKTSGFSRPNSHVTPGCVCATPGLWGCTPSAWRSMPGMKCWLFPSLCLAVLLLGLAGCSKYEPNLPSNPPDSSGWVVWLLCLLILGVCVGFLFRDGLWSNAIRLVNVVFAGLLAMNFYEWLANCHDELQRRRSIPMSPFSISSRCGPVSSSSWRSSAPSPMRFPRSACGS